MRKEYTVFYFNEEFDKALRECDEERARKLTAAWARDKRREGDTDANRI